MVHDVRSDVGPSMKDERPGAYVIILKDRTLLNSPQPHLSFRWKLHEGWIGPGCVTHRCGGMMDVHQDKDDRAELRETEGQETKEDSEGCDEAACSGCSSAGTCPSAAGGPGGVDPMAAMQKRLEDNVKRIGAVIVVMSGKGGVGKTTFAINLATAFAANGKKTGILDLDINGPDVPKMLGLDNAQITADKDGILPAMFNDNLGVISMGFFIQTEDTPIIWRGPVKTTAIRQFIADVRWGDLDVLVIDLPPGTGDEPLSIAQMIPNIDGAVIVTTPQDVALLDSKKAIRFAETLEMPVMGLVENMSGFICPHCSGSVDIFKQGGGERTAEEYNIPFLGRVPLDPSVVVAGDAGTPIVGSDSNVSEAVNSIATSILERLSG